MTCAHAEERGGEKPSECPRHVRLSAGESLSYAGSHKDHPKQ